MGITRGEASSEDEWASEYPAALWLHGGSAMAGS